MTTNNSEFIAMGKVSPDTAKVSLALKRQRAVQVLFVAVGMALALLLSHRYIAIDYQVHAAASSVQGLVAAAAKYRAKTGSYAGISMRMLAGMGLLPLQFVSTEGQLRPAHTLPLGAKWVVGTTPDTAKVVVQVIGAHDGAAYEKLTALVGVMHTCADPACTHPATGPSDGTWTAGFAHARATL